MLSNPTYECRFYRSHLDMERGVFISLSLSVYVSVLVLATLHQHDCSGWFDVLLPFFLSPTHAISTTSFAFHCSGGGSYSRSLVHLRSIGIIHLECFVFPPFSFFRFSFAWFCVCAFFTLADAFVSYISAIFVLSLLLFQDVPFSFQKGNESVFFLLLFPLIFPLFLL